MTSSESHFEEQHDAGNSISQIPAGFSLEGAVEPGATFDFFML